MARVILILLAILYTGSSIYAQDGHVQGILLTDFGIGIEDAKIIVTDEDGILHPLLVTTNALGQFSIDGLTSASNFKVQPQKLNTKEDGVDIWDLYQLSNAIALSQFDSPYQKLAADINGDGAITPADISSLKNFLLNKGEGLMPWHFYDASCLPLLSNPFGNCSQSITYEKTPKQLIFVGVKMGDLNNSVVANKNQINEHVYGEMILNTTCQKMEPGQVYDINIHLEGEEIIASQFALNLGSLELMDILVAGISVMNDVGIDLQENVVSFAEIDNTLMRSFTLKVMAKDPSKLSEMLSLATDYSKAKVYDSDGDLYELKLTFNGEAKEKLRLFQNTPNPFGEVTNIRFYLPADAITTLSVFNLNGQIQKTIQAYFPKGMNTIPILKSDLNLSGVYYYKLATGNQSVIRKMMLID